MDSPLLVTKLYVPLPRANLVVRTRLIERLEMALEDRQRLMLIAAPAGFGKTTLVTGWIASRENRLPVAWLSLDEQDNDAVLFLHLLIAALQRVEPRIGVTVQHALYLPQPPPLSDLIVSLINDISTLQTRLLLIFDDLHLVTDASVHRVIEQLVERLPPAVLTLIMTREAPPLPLARMRARGQVLEIGQRDLRFTDDETTRFFQDTVQLDLPKPALVTLNARTEGWAAGIQMAALALLNGEGSPDGFLTKFSGRHRFVTDYLAEEVIRQQPQDIQLFLMQTAVLNRLSAPLCDALTGRTDSDAILNQLEASNLFLIALDDQREWFRYHRLFAEFLRSRASAHDLLSGHRAALTWFEFGGYPDQALHHALAADDFDSAERLILASAETLFHSGSITTLQHRIDALPAERVHASVSLAVYAGLTAALTGQLAKAAAYADSATDPVTVSQVERVLLGQLSLLNTLIALAQRDDVTAIVHAREALEGLPESPWRLMALWLVAEAQERCGDISAAIGALAEAHHWAKQRSPQLIGVMIAAFLAAALHENGQSDAAAAVCEEAIARYVDDAGQPLPISALVHARLALLMLEQHRLEQAQQAHERAEALTKFLFMSELNDFIQGIGARILAARGDRTAALALLKAIVDTPEENRIADRSWLTADWVHLNLDATNLASIRAWAERYPADAEPQYLLLEEQLAYTRWLIVTGNLDSAKTWLEKLHAYTLQSEMARRQVDCCVLLALASLRARDMAQARHWLKNGLAIAAPHYWVRALLLDDADLLALLASMRADQTDFIDAVLNAARNRGITTQSDDADALSERELEVLRLVGAGLSNAEIAERLFITLATVKRHINHIYSKLDVRTRTQALIRARERDLL